MMVDWQQAVGLFSVFSILAAGVWEMRQPFSHQSLPVARRWALNFGLWISFAILTNLVLRVGPITVAAARPGEFGILPFLILVDGTLWLLHVAMHRIGLLWIWHSVHHSDYDMDASTSLRFHPVEAFIESSVVLGLVWVLRPTVSAVIAFQLLAVGSAYFVHANAALPKSVESAMQWVFMTPGLHRPHHTIDPIGQRGNYGIIFSFWDRIFATLHRQEFNPQCGVEGAPPEASIDPVHVLASLPWREWKKL